MAAGQLGKHHMLTIIVRLVEIASRAGVVILPIYFGLTLADVGIYNTLLALISLFAFAFNFERHYDIQRRSVGEDQAYFDRKVTDALYFYGFNYLTMMPLFVALVAVETHVSMGLIALVAIIVIGEHLCTQTYQFAMVNARYLMLQVIVPLRNMLTLALLGWLYWQHKGQLTLPLLLGVWASCSAVTIMAIAAIWLSIRKPTPRTAPFSLQSVVFSQHRASFTHFLIGLVAMLVIQGDRLLLPNLLAKDLVGVYARHGTVVAFGYQLFNIMSNNRILPEVFRLTRHGEMEAGRRIYIREWLRVASAVAALAVLLLTANLLTRGVYAAKFHIHPEYLLLMLLGFVLRAAADLHALPLHATHHERAILKNQLGSFVLVVVLMVGLTPWLGILGTIMATLSGAALYAALNLKAVRDLSEAPPTTDSFQDAAI